MPASEVQIMLGFQLAGFALGRPTPDTVSGVSLYPGNEFNLIDLFSDTIVAELEVYAGSSLLPGFTHRYAAEVLELLNGAGLSIEGRRLDNIAVTIADSTFAFASEAEHRADLSRRIRQLRQRAALLDEPVAAAQIGGAAGDGVTIDQVLIAIAEAGHATPALVAQLIAAHAAVTDAHHTPGGGGGGLTEEQANALIAAAVLLHAGDDDVHHAPPTLAELDGLTAAAIAALITAHTADADAHHSEVELSDDVPAVLTTNYLSLIHI